MNSPSASVTFSTDKLSSSQSVSQDTLTIHSNQIVMNPIYIDPSISIRMSSTLNKDKEEKEEEESIDSIRDQERYKIFLTRLKDKLIAYNQKNANSINQIST